MRTDGLDAVCNRLGLSAAGGSRQTADGPVLDCRLAGVEQAVADLQVPFFIQWGSQTSLPGTTKVRHPAGQSRISRASVTGDVQRLSLGLADGAVPVTTELGPSAIASIDVVSAAQVWTLGGVST